VDRIAQVLTNLLSNAHKYSPAGGKIDLKAVTVHDLVEVHVTDSGIGISPTEQSQLFTRFYRATNKVVQEAGGTGLGLAITRSLVELHGGSIRVKSTVGEGSTFTVSLPLNIVDGKHDEAATPASDTGQRRLLVVEDEPAIAGLLQRYLQRAGYLVTIATTASEGLRQARWLRPDLITLDVQLPDVDGFVLLEWLREDPGTRDIPVVFISISPNDGHGQQLGAIDHLTKPVDEGTLLNRVGQILSGDGKFVILVADDDPETRRLIVDLLRRAGHRTIEAKDGAGAVAAAENAPQLDLALIDVRMPGTDGLDALRALRNQTRTSALPIVMMTASAGVESSRSDIEALGATLVQKPLAARELVDAISAMLDRRES
jgi:CheY-like chemotaxis protein